ncbi:MAG: hypothetical protein N2053_02290 [Chitinispirillaceae bacterium]|nr:hypothetical protein [Chitinispirillaceae bacterium]
MFLLKENLYIIRNCWVSGNGYIMKRKIIESLGTLRSKESFTDYCIRAALNGWINGWLYPLIYIESMDDPRSKYTILKTDEDIRKYNPLSARLNGVTTIDGWVSQLKRSAIRVQTADFDPKQYIGWRKTVRKILYRIKRLFGIKRQW